MIKRIHPYNKKSITFPLIIPEERCQAKKIIQLFAGNQGNQ
jgi:hypothetical protein